MTDLAITTSTAVIGVAVGVDGMVAASEHQETDRRHAEELAPMIDRVLKSAAREVSTIGRILVDVGPGRFTGLRVGVATARSLAFGLQIGVVPLTSLEVLAANEMASTSVLAVVDARRQEVFQQLFVEGEAAGPAVVGSPTALATQLDLANLIAVGDGADRYQEAYRPAVITGRAVNAEMMLKLAVGRPALSGADVSPQYLRQPDVNPSIKTRQGDKKG